MNAGRVPKVWLLFQILFKAFRFHVTVILFFIVCLVFLTWNIEAIFCVKLDSLMHFNGGMEGAGGIINRSLYILKFYTRHVIPWVQESSYTT